MSRPTSAMERLKMTAPFVPGRRKTAGYIVKWTDPISGRRRQQKLGTRKKREAWCLAADLADEIESGAAIGGVPWLTFCERYEQQHLAKLSPKSIEGWRTVKWFVEEACPLNSIQQANDVWVDRFIDAVLAKEVSTNTEATYLARIKAALSWACKKRYLRQMPYIAVNWERRPRSEAVTAKQFEAMLAAIPAVRPKDWPLWRRLMRGQYFTGLRISELLELSWDLSADIRVVDGDRPVIRFDRQKNRQRQVRPVVPEAWEIIAESPVRSGVVFPIPGARGQMSTKKVIQRVSEIGEAAGVVTNRETGKFASSHDIRRAFYDWCAEKYGKKIASLLMRHADEQTTDTFYNTHEAEQLGDLLWSQQ